MLISCDNKMHEMKYFTKWCRHKWCSTKKNHCESKHRKHKNLIRNMKATIYIYVVMQLELIFSNHPLVFIRILARTGPFKGWQHGCGYMPWYKRSWQCLVNPPNQVQVRRTLRGCPFFPFLSSFTNRRNQNAREGGARKILKSTS